MIEPGWKTDCPSCGGSERLGERFEIAMKAQEPTFTSYKMFLFSGPKSLPLAVFADICSHCGTVYAYKCTEHKGLMDAASAS